MKQRRFLLIFIFIMALLIAACGLFAIDEPPGVGEKAERGYALSEPVIAALEQFKTDQGFYPEALAELVPEYITAIPQKDDLLDFSYRLTDDGFAFSFHYIGPGMNTCTYTPEKKWQCSGAY